MHWHKDNLEVITRGKGLYPFTQAVNACIKGWGIQEGMGYVFLPHTSASLIINESFDPSAKTDLETFLEKLAPENQSWHQHTLEGPDDTTSHLKAMLTQNSLTIPIDQGRLSLGTWQGIYLFEHRARSQRRQILLRCLQVI